VNDPSFEDIILKLKDTIIVNDKFPYELQGEVLLYKEHLCLPSHGSWQIDMLQDHHSSSLAGHFGVAKSYEFLKRSYYWPCMLKDVKEYVRACVSCQQNKVEQLKLAGLLQPLPIPEGIWKSISLDFIMQLPMSSNMHNDAIMVVVCRLSKQAHFIPTHTTISAVDTTKFFF
jgi:hypothetical protein